MTSTSRSSTYAALLGAAAGLLMTSGVTSQPGAAAHLEVDGGVAQYWEFDVKAPEQEQPQQPEVDLSACGPLEQYEEVVVYGTEGPDVLSAGNGRQIIVGLGGADQIEGGNDDDCLIGGNGDDTLIGGNGDDILVGGLGSDRLDGGRGRDVLDADAEDTCVDLERADEAVGCPATETTDAVEQEQVAKDDAPSSAESQQSEPDTRSFGDESPKPSVRPQSDEPTVTSAVEPSTAPEDSQTRDESAATDDGVTAP